METIVDKAKCSGCYSCINICPKKAIKMKEDNKGFKYPEIDNEKCVNCGMCRKSCPIINKIKENNYKVKAYAAYNKNFEERINSSSGGIFVLLAKEILKRKGVVFGAMYDDNFDVFHNYIDNKKDLYKLMGSKYTQSTIGDSYFKVKKILEKDKYVLFTGTPCQISGLRTYLQKDYEKLYTQDIICHGVPSPKLWRKYLKYQEEKNKEKISNVSFRNKDYGWSLFQIKIWFENKIYSQARATDLFMQSFLKNICLRDSCYNCSFKSMHKDSDITLADYWGINDVHPEMNDDKGASLLIVNSQKGAELFDLIKKDVIYIDTNIESALEKNSAMFKSAEHCINEEKFVNNMDKIDIEKLVKNYVPCYPDASLYRKIINKIKNKFKK